MPAEFPYTAAEERAVARALDRFERIAKYRTTLRTQLERWAWFVAEVEAGYDDVIEEYWNDLDVRDIIRDLLADAPQELRMRLAPWLRGLDERFLAATRSADRVVATRGGESWSDRIPLRPGAELQEDLDLFGLS